jgi:hypothetical protein
MGDYGAGVGEFALDGIHDAAPEGQTGWISRFVDFHGLRGRKTAHGGAMLIDQHSSNEFDVRLNEHVKSSRLLSNMVTE